MSRAKKYRLMEMKRNIHKQVVSFGMWLCIVGKGWCENI